MQNHTDNHTLVSFPDPSYQPNPLLTDTGSIFTGKTLCSEETTKIIEETDGDEVHEYTAWEVRFTMFKIFARITLVVLSPVLLYASFILFLIYMAKEGTCQS